MKFLEEIQQELARLEREGQKRSLRHLEEVKEGYLKIQGRWLLNLASNDYLGLASKIKLEEVLARFPELSSGAGASRLLAGNHPLYHLLEAALERAYGRSALVFSCGYMANLALITTLCGRRDAIFADKLVHASLIDGLRLSSARYFRYPHLDLNALEDLLRQHRPKYQRALIVTESVFSMDGDVADLQGLLQLKEKYGALLMVDEAHAVGVLGPSGLGLAEEQGLLEKIDLILGTFGKALGSYGAFLITHPKIKEYLVNKARPFIFTTALPPVVVATSWLGLEKASQMEAQRKELRQKASAFRRALGLEAQGLAGETPIVPLILGENQKALALAEELYQRGYFVPAIRPPTVPPGTARLRISLTASTPWEELQEVARIIRSFNSAGG